MDIVIGIPAYNEEKNIASLLLKLKRITSKIIVCNDGSSDSTGEIAKNLGAVVINHEKNFGYGAAIKSILSKGIEIDADILVTFDADGQHQVEDIRTVVEPILQNKADIVIGSRFLDDGEKNVPAYRKVGIKTITSLTNLSTDTKITDSQSGFRAYSKATLKDIIPSEHGMGVSTEILIKASKKKFRIVEVPIVVLYGQDTSTHHPVSHGLSVVLSTMKFISTDHPLKFYGVPGLGFLGIGLFFIIWTIQVFSESRTILTNVALIGFASTLIGIMLIMTAIILFSLVNVVRESRS